MKHYQIKLLKGKKRRHRKDENSQRKGCVVPFRFYLFLSLSQHAKETQKKKVDFKGRVKKKKVHEALDFRFFNFCKEVAVPLE